MRSICKSLFVLSIPAAVLPGSAALAADTPQLPNLVGLWDRGATAGTPFPQPESGPGPIHDTAPADEPDAGWRGNYDSPILQPWAAAVVKEKVDLDIAGINVPERKEICAPMGVPHILQLNGPILLLPGPEIFTILYTRMTTPRFIHVNEKHPDDLTPSYYGHSIGHWEGDAFVVDTVGFTADTPIDMFATPHTEKLHVVERYHLVDDGETLRVDLMVEDQGAFTTPWRTYVTYGEPDEPWLEFICPENNRYPDGSLVPLPTDETPDF
jgi:hypothetical protein